MCSLEVPISHLERSVAKQVLSPSHSVVFFYSHVSGTCQIHSWHWRGSVCHSASISGVMLLSKSKTQNLWGKKCSFRISHSSSILRYPIVKLNMLFTQRNVVSCSQLYLCNITFQETWGGAHTRRHSHCCTAAVRKKP